MLSLAVFTAVFNLFISTMGSMIGWTMTHWYLVRVKLNYEVHVADALKNQGIETYVPLYLDWSKKGELERKVVFAGYLFIKLDFEHVPPDLLKFINSLIRFVKFEDQPITMTDDDLHRLREEVPSVILKEILRLNPGESVLVVSKDFNYEPARYVFPSTCGQVKVWLINEELIQTVPITTVVRSQPVYKLFDSVLPNNLLRVYGHSVIVNNKKINRSLLNLELPVVARKNTGNNRSRYRSSRGRGRPINKAARVSRSLR